MQNSSDLNKYEEILFFTSYASSSGRLLTNEKRAKN